MKKKLFVLGGLVLACSGLLLCGFKSPVPVRAEGEITEPVCSVELGTSKHGEVTLDIEEGQVGDICTVSVDADAFYIVNEIKVNDVVIMPGEDGLYKFALVEGKNVVSVTYVVDPEIAGELSTLIDKAEEAGETGDFSDLFTPENMALLFNYLVNIGYGLALVVSQIKNGKYKNLDRAEIVKEIRSALPENVNNIVSELVEKQVLPTVLDIRTQFDDVTTTLKTFIQAFVYNLEGTDESKQSVIKLLSGLKLTDNTAVTEVTKFFEDKLNALKAEYDDKIKLLEEFKITNNEALKEAGKIEEIKEEAKEDEVYDGTTI